MILLLYFPEPQKMRGRPYRVLCGYPFLVFYSNVRQIGVQRIRDELRLDVLAKTFALSESVAIVAPGRARASGTAR